MTRGASQRARSCAAALAAFAWAACAAPAPAPRANPPAQDALSALEAAPAVSGRPALVVLLSVAGLTAEVYRAPGPSTPVMPTLRRLADAGVAADRVERVAPAAAYPVHTTLVSGLLPARHGIPADHRLGERGVRTALYSHASLLRGPTLWQAAVARGVSVAALDWPATVGAAIPLLLPDLVPTRRGETWRALVHESASPWIHARVAAEPDVAVDEPGPARDAFLITTLCELAASPTPPSLALVRLAQTELELVRSGPDTDAARAAFARVDTELARLVECLAASGRLADTALVIVGDRDFLPVHSVLHVNEALAEAGLLSGGEPWQAIVRSNGGSAFVYARDTEAALAARRALEREAADTRAFRIVAAEEMIGLGADPEAWFGLEAEPGYLFADERGEPRVWATPVRGGSGYLFAGDSPGFVAFGRGFRRGLRVPTLRQEDVAPTLALLLDAKLADAEGRPLLGALDLPRDRSRAAAQ